MNGHPLAALLSAAADGNGDRVRELLGAHPALVNQRGVLPGHTGLRSALHFAVGGSHENVVALLLELGAHPNIRDEGDNATPLHFAAEKENLAIIQLLVEHGADVVGAGNVHELEILGWATVFGTGRPDVVEYLLANGAEHTMASAVATGDTSAIRAIAARTPGAYDVRLDDGNRQRTMLHLAVVRKQHASLTTLLELGADVNATDVGALTPLDQAALIGDSDMVDALLQHGARLELPAAVALGRTDDVDRILQLEPMLLLPGNLYRDLLVQASERAPGPVLKDLICHGASVNASADTDVAVDGARGYTALHAAAFHGNVSGVEALLTAGASVRAREERYCATPAGWAQYAGHHAVAELILAGDIDIFEAIDFDLTSRVEEIAEGDPGALERPFGDYVKCELHDEQHWRTAATTPMDAALTRGNAETVVMLRELLARRDGLVRAERVSRFLRNACRDWRTGGGGSIRMARHTAARLLQQYPEIATENIFTAVACGDVAEVKRFLAERPGVAVDAGGPRNWTPLLYLASARIPHAAASDNAVEIAMLLLTHGADPNAHCPGGDESIRYTVLTCIMGMGEEQAPPHPRARELAELLLEHGAEPYDPQVLYNVFADHASRPHLRDDLIWLLELMRTYSVRKGRASDWDDPDWEMLDMGGYGPGAYYLLSAAASTGLLRMTEWMLAHGASPNSPTAGSRKARPSVVDMAMRCGHSAIADLLVRDGAKPSTPVLAGYPLFMDACTRLDRNLATALVREHPEYLRDPRALFDAAAFDRPDVVALLLDLGVSPDVSDAKDGNRRALHVAAFAGAHDAAEVLIARGADVDARETHYGATPMGMASWAQQPAMSELLGRHSRDIFSLTLAGNVARVRQLMKREPSLATGIHPNGTSVLMWLPDDEDAAVALTELLLSHGADPWFRDPRGTTAKRIAEQRAMNRVVALLGRSSSP